jgi:VanZ family protein
LNRAERYFYWLPALAWTLVILIWSGAAGAPSVSGSWLEWFIPSGGNAAMFETVHFTLRKLAHVVAYGILGYLNFRALRGPRPGFQRGWSVAAIGLALVVAAVDEWNQSKLPFRSGSGFDVMLDLSGAMLAQLIVRLRSGVLFS